MFKDSYQEAVREIHLSDALKNDTIRKMNAAKSHTHHRAVIGWVSAAAAACICMLVFLKSSSSFGNMDSQTGNTAAPEAAEYNEAEMKSAQLPKASKDKDSGTSSALTASQQMPKTDNPSTALANSPAPFMASSEIDAFKIDAFEQEVLLDYGYLYFNDIPLGTARAAVEKEFLSGDQENTWKIEDVQAYFGSDPRPNNLPADLALLSPLEFTVSDEESSKSFYFLYGVSDAKPSDTRQLEIWVNKATAASIAEKDVISSNIGNTPMILSHYYSDQTLEFFEATFTYKTADYHIIAKNLSQWEFIDILSGIVYTEK